MEFHFDTSDIRRIEEAMRRGANRTPDAIRRAINWTGDRARTQVARVGAKQTGLPYRVIRRALVRKAANYSALVYRLRVRGGDVRLKYFKARETRRGVTAAPWGRRQLYAGAFIKGGRFPARVPLGMGGQVFRRSGTGRKPIQLMRSGLFIPEELVKGESAAAFQQTVTALLPGRVEHEIAFALSGG
jgi:hypothetical protein